MRVTIHPSRLSGTICANASKSSMQRACAAALLSKGETILRNPGNSNDDKAAIEIIKTLGADVKAEGDELIIKSPGLPFAIDDSRLTIDCGESGLSIRMFTPVASLSDKEIIITGSGSLADRPMDFFDQILPQLGVKIKSNNGKLPMVIRGPLQPKNIEVDGSLSSQFLTGLLMAFSAATPKSSPKGRTSEVSGIPNVSINVRDLKSKPYIDLTLEVMQAFGMRIPENKNYEEFVFSSDLHNSQFPALDSGLRAPDLPVRQAGSRPACRTGRLPNRVYTIEGDWSGAAFLLVAGAIAGPITVTGLDMMSTQADRAVYDALISANANIVLEAKGLKVCTSALKAFEFDAADCPDLFPPLVALAAYCEGETKIKGVSRLKHKESNRAVTLMEEFGKMGIKIEFDDEVMTIYGGRGIKGATVHSRHDHRIAMACAVAALKAEGETVIEEAQAVKKSYPDFYNHLKSLGASVSLPYQLFNL